MRTMSIWLACAMTVGCTDPDPQGDSNLSIAIDGTGGGIVNVTFSNRETVSCRRSCQVALPDDATSVHVAIETRDGVRSPCPDGAVSCDLEIAAGDTVPVGFDPIDSHELTTLYLDEPGTLAIIEGDLVIETGTTLTRMRTDGEVVWRVPLTVTGGLQAHGDLIVIANFQDGLVAYHTDGTLAWSAPSGPVRMSFGSTGDVLVTGEFSNVVAIDRATGTTHWQTSGGEDGLGAAVSGSDGTVFFTLPGQRSIARFDRDGHALPSVVSPIPVEGMFAMPDTDLMVLSVSEYSIEYSRIDTTGSATTFGSETGLPQNALAVVSHGDTLFELHDISGTMPTPSEYLVSELDGTASILWSIRKSTDGNPTWVACDDDKLCAVSGVSADCAPSPISACAWVEVFETD